MFACALTPNWSYTLPFVRPYMYWLRLCMYVSVSRNILYLKQSMAFIWRGQCLCFVENVLRKENENKITRLQSKRIHLTISIQWNSLHLLLVLSSMSTTSVLSPSSPCTMHICAFIINAIKKINVLYHGNMKRESSKSIATTTLSIFSLAHSFVRSFIRLFVC